MTAKRDLDDLRNTIRPLRHYVGQKLQHVKSGDWYRVVSVQFCEADMAIEFTYETLHSDDPIAFSRPIAELLDGRFRFS